MKLVRHTGLHAPEVQNALAVCSMQCLAAQFMAKNKTLPNAEQRACLRITVPCLPFPLGWKGTPNCLPLSRDMVPAMYQGDAAQKVQLSLVIIALASGLQLKGRSQRMGKYITGWFTI